VSPSLSELLRYIAEHEPLSATVSAHPGLDRPALRAQLLEAASRLAATGEKPLPQFEKVSLDPAQAPGGKTTRAAPVGSGPAVGASGARSSGASGARPSGPVAKRLRVYSDGAARGNPGLSGAGAVIAAEDGTVIERLGKFLGVQTNNVAEYTALLLGLEQARAMGADAVDVFADSELMIRQLEGRYQVKAPGLKPLYEKARALLRGFKDVRLQHIPRAQNADADEMSNRAIDERMG
jgi:ribonuclease HI